MGAVGSGRCHGPRCQQDATRGPWCSTTCQEAWHTQFHWLHGDGQVQEPVLVPAVEEPDEAQLNEALAAAVDVARADFERVHGDVTTQPASERPASSIVDEIKAAYIQFADMPQSEPFKLTRWQRDALLAHGSTRWQDGTPMGLLGVPIEIVATVEESTPYLLAERARAKRVWLDDVVVAESATEPVGDLVMRFVMCYTDGSPTSAGTTYPLVASKDPQVAHSGWLGRLFNRRRRP